MGLLELQGESAVEIQDRFALTGFDCPSHEVWPVVHEPKRIVAKLTKGETTYQGETARLTWGSADIPLYVAASGPKTLELAGEVADGVIIQTGLLPEVVEDALACIRRGAERAGRDFDKIVAHRYHGI